MDRLNRARDAAAGPELPEYEALVARFDSLSKKEHSRLEGLREELSILPDTHYGLVSKARDSSREQRELTSEYEEILRRQRSRREGDTERLQELCKLLGHSQYEHFKNMRRAWDATAG